MDKEEIAAAIREEFDVTGDWVSIAGALGVVGINSWDATRSDVAAVIRCVDETRDLRLGTVGGGFDEIGPPLPVETILDRVFREPSSQDRAALMMTYFIDVREPGHP